MELLITIVVSKIIRIQNSLRRYLSAAKFQVILKFWIKQDCIVWLRIYIYKGKIRYILYKIFTCLNVISASPVVFFKWVLIMFFSLSPEFHPNLLKIFGIIDNHPKLVSLIQWNKSDLFRLYLSLYLFWLYFVRNKMIISYLLSIMWNVNVNVVKAIFIN